MKLKSAFLALVLLLLTVTVCAAQSSMGFSPTMFYEVFDQLNSITEGPECIYARGNEEEGAFILNSETIGINMMYSGEKVTDLYYFYSYLSTDQEASDAAFGMLFSTIHTLLAFAQHENREVFKNFDSNQWVDEVSALYVLLLTNDGPQDYWGYHFQMEKREENGHREGIMWVTKSDSAEFKLIEQ